MDTGLQRETSFTEKDFEDVARNNICKNIDASRLTLSKMTGTIETEENTGSFFGKVIRWLTGAESNENRAILSAFKKTIRLKYGDNIATTIFSLDFEQKILKDGLKPCTVLKAILHAREKKTILDAHENDALEESGVATPMKTANAQPLREQEEFAQAVLKGDEPKYIDDTSQILAALILNSSKPLTEVQAVFADAVIVDHAADHTNATFPLVATNARPYHLTDQERQQNRKNSLPVLKDAQNLTDEQIAEQDKLHYERGGIYQSKILD